ncbi:WAP four-disulfide core domain protein 5 isoform X2 [Mesocricetus auratus]|uniref:WAP four-disulfide core domain protein 5 isoform X2 n=1 Tax=Mesocricetus auratus TaxID=10036 RepID=A0ABM2WKJ4_MESAU|nr:WAP four-disulfide core domain protein 5 isoform X2 [Mesocricetus auratus]
MQALIVLWSSSPDSTALALLILGPLGPELIGCHKRNMRIQGSLLLVVLLALETQLPVALCRNKGDKLGGCPPDDGPCLQVTPDQCLNDRQCPSSLKCCSRSCFLQCVPRVSG